MRQLKECSYLFITKDGRVWNDKRKRWSSQNKVYVPGRGPVRPLRLLKETYPWGFLEDLGEDEELRPITDFPGYYVSNRGRVWSEGTYSWLEGTPSPRCYYYREVQLWKDGKCYGRKLHTLVGRHFLPDWKEGLFILHREEDIPEPEINFPENLYVGTLSDNTRDQIRKGRHNNFGKGGVTRLRE
jgi:hypothetical protein